jgi:hypothetical protein
MNEWLQGDSRLKRKAKVTGSVGVGHEFKIKQYSPIRSNGPFGNDQFKASTGQLDRGTILCGTESVGSLQM